MAHETRSSAVKLASDIRYGYVSPTTVVDETFERIDQANDEFNAFVRLREAEAREEAADATRAIEDGEPLGPLHGVPVALKDLDTFIEGMPYTLGGLKPLGEFMPDRTSVVVQRLMDAGAIVVGSTNSPEFGVSGDTTNAMYGSTGNPFDSRKTAGGSSGGAASAVGTRMVPLALGSDVAGSIRIPASACGTFGLKPTTGLVPNDDRPNAFRHQAPFLTKGGITRTVEDAALLLDVISGYHPRDPLSVPSDADYRAAVDRSVGDLSVAYSPDFGLFDVEPVVADRVEDAVETLDRAGATVERIELEFGPSFEEIIESYWTLILPDLASAFENFEREMGVDLLGDHRDEISSHLVEYVEAGREYSAVELGPANAVRTLVYEEIQRTLGEYDLLLTPTLAMPPFEKGTHAPDEIDGTPVEEPNAGMEWLLTWPLNLTGHPAASVPAGFSPDGLPIGAQLVGSRFDEETILAASAAIERRQPWRDEYPELYR